MRDFFVVYEGIYPTNPAAIHTMNLHGPRPASALSAATKIRKKPHQPLHTIRRDARSLSRRQAQNSVIKDTVYSSYGNSGKMSHLGGFGLRMAHIAAQKPSHGKTKPYP